jgi:hypothetical protein
MIIANGPNGVRLELARLENACLKQAGPGNNSSARLKIA